MRAICCIAEPPKSACRGAPLPAQMIDPESVQYRLFSWSVPPDWYQQDRLILIGLISSTYSFMSIVSNPLLSCSMIRVLMFVVPSMMVQISSHHMMISFGIFPDSLQGSHKGKVISHSHYSKHDVALAESPTK